jgi:hypothetical protein
MRTGYQFIPVSKQIEDTFAGCVYIRDMHQILVPDGSLLGPDQFKAWYGGRSYAMDLDGSLKPTQDAWKAYTQSQGYDFPRAHGICFRPELPAGAIIQEEGRSLVNTYVPIDTAATAGDPGPFLDVLRRMLPDDGDRNILLAYIAAMVQYPGVKFQWAPLLQGLEGNGKTMIVEALTHAIGARYTHLPNPKDLSNKFNAWVLGKLFIAIEEVFVADKQDLIDTLKPLITNLRLEIQGKGGNQITGDNRANFILTSNHKDAVRKTPRDRRYCVLYTAQQVAGDLERDGMDGQYFPRAYRWLRKEGGKEIVNHYLRQYAIPEALNPAMQCHRAPETTSTQAAIKASRGSLEQDILDATERGLPGFCGGWISSGALDRLLKDLGMKRMAHSKRYECLEELGYTPHPAFKSGRVNQYFMDCGINDRPRLFVRKGSLQSQIAEGKRALRAYQEAQKESDANFTVGGSTDAVPVSM